MVIDVKNLHSLTNFSNKQKGSEAKKSDHNPMYADIKIQGKQVPQERMEYFNFKDKDSLEKFRKMTTETNDFTKCFTNDKPFHQQMKKWERTSNTFFIRCFKKIRKRHKKRKPSQFHILLNKRQEALENGNLDEIESIENKINDEEGKSNRDKIMENFKELQG